MNYGEFTNFVQQHFTDGLVLVVGSGLSVAEGIPGMGALATALDAAQGLLQGADATWWNQAKGVVANEGLEAALLKHRPSEKAEQWISATVVREILPAERKVLSQAFNGQIELKLTAFLKQHAKVLKQIPIVTTNYDRLVEFACETAGYHVDTGAVGIYSGAFDHQRSCMGSVKAPVQRGKSLGLDHFPRAVVLKPHGSLDWFQSKGTPLRCSLDLDAERLMITPGLNKYRAGYERPFDKHRELANSYIDQAARLLIVGYGFNDDHLQTHLSQRIRNGVPALILTRTPTKAAVQLTQQAPRCVCVSDLSNQKICIETLNVRVEHTGPAVWQLDVLSKEILS